MALQSNGILDRATDASNAYLRAKSTEEEELASAEEYMDQFQSGGKTKKEKFSSEDVSKIIEKAYDENTLTEVEYQPEQDNEASVTISNTYNSGIGDQLLTQENTGARNAKWYVLSANENEVKLVSSISEKSVIFKSSGGYDNCLFYLNQIAKKLYSNENLGVTEDKVHALNLSDIKGATELANGEGYSFDTSVIDGASYKCKNFKSTTYYTDSSKTSWPEIYAEKLNGTEIVTDNDMYDETALNAPIEDSQIWRTRAGNPATNLTVTGTGWQYWANNGTKTRDNMGAFGSSSLAKNNLFIDYNDNSVPSSAKKYFLASRCIWAQDSSNDFCYYCIRVVSERSHFL